MTRSGNRILYHPKVTEDLKSIDAHIKLRIKKAIESKLAVAPEIYGEPLRGTLKQSWKLRVGDWRIGYIIVKKIVKIIIIGHRSRIYEEFERRIK